jgi:hypothetical protein
MQRNVVRLHKTCESNLSCDGAGLDLAQAVEASNTIVERKPAGSIGIRKIANLKRHTFRFRETHIKKGIRNEAELNLPCWRMLLIIDEILHASSNCTQSRSGIAAPSVLHLLRF